MAGGQGHHRGAAGKGHVLVKKLEAVGQGQKYADGDGGHYVGNDHLPKGLPAVGTINGGGLQHIPGHGLQPGNVDDHHIADLLPGQQNDEPPEAIGGVGGKIGVVGVEDTVEDHLPDIPQHHAADKVGHEEHRAERLEPLSFWVRA